MNSFTKIKLQMIKDSPIIFTPEKIKGSDDAIKLINNIEHYELSPTRKMILIGLNIKNDILMYTEIATGTVNAVHVTPAEIFKPLLVANCSKFILAHNSTSGDTTPSSTDINFKNVMQETSKMMGIELLDYIIIADADHYASIMKK